MAVYITVMKPFRSKNDFSIYVRYQNLHNNKPLNLLLSNIKPPDEY